MPGTLQDRIVVEVHEVQTDDEGIALALAMCPPGHSVELHAMECTIDVGNCTCSPRVITAPPRASA
jgi:hypothetical protein